MILTRVSTTCPCQQRTFHFSQKASTYNPIILYYIRYQTQVFKKDPGSWKYLLTSLGISIEAVSLSRPFSPLNILPGQITERNTAPALIKVNFASVIMPYQLSICRYQVAVAISMQILNSICQQPSLQLMKNV